MSGKSIGILTFWGVPNYGAFAQAYALNHFLSTLYEEDEVRHIAWLHPTHKELYFSYGMPQVTLRNLTHPHWYASAVKHFFHCEREYPGFVDTWTAIPHIDVDSEEDLERRYWDTLITGSDAIWQFSTEAFGKDSHLIGNRMNCGNLVAYAASFGDISFQESCEPFIKEGLSRYNHISVRDDYSASIVTQLTGEIPPIVMDPVFLWDFPNDKGIPEVKYKKYILVYGGTFTDFQIREIKGYARQNGLVTLGAGIVPEWCDIRLPKVNAMEWIGLFRDATLVATCTFHGLMFSIIYQRKFYFHRVPYVKNRSEHILSGLGMLDWFGEDMTLESVLGHDWDYTQINRKLDNMRKQSIKFISTALGNGKEG